MSEGNGVGRLRAILEAAALPLRTGKGGRLNLTRFTVLASQNDPYRFDTPIGHVYGQWLREQVDRFVASGRTIHLRGLHYQIVAAGNIKIPLEIKGLTIKYGKPYRNDEEHWEWLVQRVSSAARWLGYVPFEAIHDGRNAAPERNTEIAPRPDSTKPQAIISAGGLSAEQVIKVPKLFLPYPAALGFRQAAQPYRIIFIGEKASLGDVLGPLAREVKAELLLPTGEASTTMIREAAVRAAEDDWRPAVMLYFADFDPSGYQMPVSVARKLQAFIDFDSEDLDIQVHRVALTADQVRALDLPSTPLKATELRADKWRAKWGVEQTEIDALAALRPGELERIAREALKPFYDPTLARRQLSAEALWRVEAQRVLEADPTYGPAREQIEAAYARFTEVIETAHEAFERAHEEAVESIAKIELPPIKPPKVQLDAEPPAPLYTSKDSFEVATAKLKADKALAGDDVVEKEE